jgi:protocatechuate 3,4-dioxygenase beta subunit
LRRARRLFGLCETFLRGTQFTEADGSVRFDTIYPGWYPGRTPHIHFKVILDDKVRVTGQLYFPDTVSERIYAAYSPYRERKQERETVNANDFIFSRGERRGHPGRDGRARRFLSRFARHRHRPRRARRRGPRRKRDVTLGDSC